MAQRPRPADRKDQLAAVASALFSERGYRSVGVDDIAAAAGVTGPAIYRHFPDKQAILARVVLAGVADLEACTAQALADPGGSPTRHLLTRVAEVAVRRPDAAVLWRWSGADLAADERAEVRRRSRALLGTWTATLLAAGGGGEPADAELAAWAVMSVMGSPIAHRSRLGAAAQAALLVAASERVIGTDLAAARTAPAPSPGPAPAGGGTRREQLVDAASGLFRDRGYHAVSIADLGAAVGIAGPSVYRHFPSKAAVLVAICRRSAQRLEVAADEAVRGAPTPSAVVRALVGSYVGVLAGSPDLVVGFTADHTQLTPAERAELLEAQRAYVARWVDALRGTHPDLGASAARVLVHAALGVANDVSRTRRLTAREHWRPELVALCCAALDV
ncbi:TetR/AcrR family transcriptional regulator [Rhodococcus aerolatus]